MALLDILTEAQAIRAALGGDDPGSHLTEIVRANSAISARIDALVGPVVQREVTEYHDGGVIRPFQTPVTSVTSVTEWDGSTQTVLTEVAWGVAGSGFSVERSSTHDVVIRASERRFVSGVRSVRLVYVAGRALDTSSVPVRYTEAAAGVMRRLWNREAGAWARGTDPFEQDASSPRFFRAVDYVVDELLHDEKLPPLVA